MLMRRRDGTGGGMLIRRKKSTGGDMIIQDVFNWETCKESRVIKFITTQLIFRTFDA